MVVSDVEEQPGGRQAATLTYTVDGRTWSQRILTQNLSDDQLAAEMAEAGLDLEEYLIPDKTWVRARPR
jgi:Tfp pilus assembly protein PilX